MSEVLNMTVCFLEDNLFVSRDFISRMYRVKIRTTQRWKIPESEVAIGKSKMFNWRDIQAWHDINIKKSNLKEIAPLVVEDTKEDDLSLLGIGELERRKKANDVALGNIKIKKELEELIDANDVDKAMAELAITLKSHLTASEKVFPILLENKSASDVKKITTKYNSKILRDLTAIFKREYDCDETLDDVVLAVLKSKKTPKQIIALINE